MIQTSGTVMDIIYRNKENLFSVFVLETDDGLITVVGKILELNKGDILSVTGDLVYHDEYGEQIKLKTYEKTLPITVSQIEKYLSSGIISNIGPKRAKEIVNRFGEDTLNIITERPEELLKISGIGGKTLEKIYTSAQKTKDSREVHLYLQKFNLGPKMMSDIFLKYKDKTKEVIENNPYRLIEEIKGVGFLTADKIAIKIGIRPDSEFRIRAGMLYILLSAENNDGDCYLEQKSFIKRTTDLLKIDYKLIEEQISVLVFDNKIKVEEIEGENRVYLRSVYETELSIVNRLMQLLNTNKKFDDFDIEKEIDFIEKLEKIEYSETQKTAISTALSENLMIITGGPGTGKTTIIKAIISIIKNINLKYVLCAPTGRAAKRMEESTGQEASTIHKLLGYKSLSDEFSLDFNEENPLDIDFVIVDEVSMVDIYLMNNLLKALKRDTVLILVGDSDQLPSVGPGNVLNDMLNSGIIPTIKLDTIFRQGEGSNIIKNAHLINHGKYPILNEEGKDFFFIETKNNQDTLNTIVDLVTNRLPKHYKVNPIEDIQVITPTRRGICGVDNINIQLQEKLNSESFNKIEIKFGENIYRENDKIMQIKNNYDIELKDKNLTTQKGVFNGDIGYIKNIYPETRELEIDYEGKIAKYSFNDLGEISLSYSITIHKSQGSEFPIVVIPMANAPYMLLTRNILYTAITRGKSIVVLVGDKRIMKTMIENINKKQRNSTLEYQLKKIANLRKIYD